MVLIVEPSKQLAEVIRAALEQAAFKTKVAHTSQTAIEAADNKNLQAVIIELLMPGHNGLEFIYEFRSYEDWVDIPIIAYSQLSQEELALNATLKAEMGIAAQLYKPTTTLKELVKEVRRVIL